MPPEDGTIVVLSYTFFAGHQRLEEAKRLLIPYHQAKAMANNMRDLIEYTDVAIFAPVPQDEWEQQ